MDSPAGPPPPPPTRRAPAPDNASSQAALADQATIDHLLSILAKLSTQGGVQRIGRLLQDYEGLSHELDEFKTTCSVLSSSLARAESRIREDEALSKEFNDKIQASEKKTEEQKSIGDGLRGQISALDEQIRNITMTAKKYSTDMIRHENVAKSLSLELENALKQVEALKKELAAEQSMRKKTASELEGDRQTLVRFRSFVVDMTPLDRIRDQVSRAQDSAFNAALGVFGKTFAHDFEDALLQDEAAWDRLKNNEALRRFRHPLPLPASNSPAAKRMRAIAALALYADALARYVFRPTYLMPGGHLDDFLDVVARKSPAHEAYLRAVLHKVPSGREDTIEACATLVAEEVMRALSGCIPQGIVGELQPAILGLATTEGNNWKVVQRTEERITADFSLIYPDDWRRFPAAPSSTRQNSNGQPAQPPSKQASDNKRAGQVAGSSPLQKGEMIGAIWPAFLAACVQQQPAEDSSGWELVQPGYVLTQRDIKDAEEEIITRRGARQAVRRSGTGNGRSRRDSAVSFLSQKPSAGSDVK